MTTATRTHLTDPGSRDDVVTYLLATRAENHATDDPRSTWSHAVRVGRHESWIAIGSDGQVDAYCACATGYSDERWHERADNAAQAAQKVADHLDEPMRLAQLEAKVETLVGITLAQRGAAAELHDL